MKNDVQTVKLGIVASDGIKKQTHVPSKMQADTLFTFSTKLDYLLPIIKERLISPRFCVEDIRYLGIKGLKRIAFPMKCFCDINLHRLEDHLQWYGYYGLAFSKEWGMHKDIQPIQYINPHSNLCKDFATAFSGALKILRDNESKEQCQMKNYLIYQMMYMKPYEGFIKNRNTNRRLQKCFTDECEWRFIPDVTVEGFQQAYHDPKVLNQPDILDSMSNSLIGKQSVSLDFSYTDLKYIIIKTVEDFHRLTNYIEEQKLNRNDE